MIYKILADGTSIFNYDYKDMVLLDPTLEMELNTSGGLTFTMPPGHVFYDSVNLLTTDIEVYEDETLLFFGRPVEIKTDYYKQKKIYCEGALAFFNDSVQELHEYTSISIHEFFRIVIAKHNEQVDENRQFIVGNITIGDKTVYRKLHYEQTMDVLKRQCLQAEGGYFFIRKEDGKNVIDWLLELPYTTNQPIEFGLNLLSIGSGTAGGDIATCVLPLGDDDEETHLPITIESINGGSKIIESDAVETYGKITKAVTFSGVTNPATLYEDGLEYLSSLQFDKISIECEASELHYLNGEYEGFQIGQMVRCVSEPHLVDRYLPLYKMSLELDTAVKKITLGTKTEQTLTEIYAENDAASGDQSVVELQDNYEDLRDDYSDLETDYSEFKDDVTDFMNESSGWKHWIGTRAEYDALATKDSETIYFVESEQS